MYKKSKYLLSAQYRNFLLLYSPIKNIILPIDENDILSITNYLDNIDLLEKMEPQLFNFLKNHGFIVDVDLNETNFIIVQNRMRIFNDRFYRLTINPTLDCNMSCWYCTVDAAGNDRPKSRMSDQTINNTIEHIKYQISNNQIDGLFLDWFGGEPLLFFDEVIYPISKAAQKLSLEKDLTFMQFITTNGYLIDSLRIDKMNEIGLNSFQITLDGNRAKHNSIRKHYESNTYDRILSNISMICTNIENPTIHLRINYDRRTLDELSELIEWMKMPNIRDNIIVNFQKVFQVPRKSDKENEDLVEVMKKLEYNGIKTQYWAFRPQSYYTCYSDKFYHRVINYDGYIYKCTARNYNEENRIGVLKEDGIIELNSQKISNLFAKSTFENEKCLDCSFLPLCFGPCIQKNYEVRFKNANFKCLFDDAELSVNNFIISEAKKRQLVN